MEVKDSGTRVKAPTALVCYAYVWQPRANQDPTKDAKYSVTLLWPKSADLSALKKAATAAARKKWGDKIPSNLRSPFREGNSDRSDDPVFKDMIFISARSKDKPGIVDRMVHPITNEMDFYSGCMANVTINAFGYDNNGNKGVSFALGNIQKVSDGPRLTGQRPPDEDFDNLGADANAAGAGGGDDDNLF